MPATICSANRAAFAFPRADLFRYSAQVVELSRSAGGASAARRRGAPRLDGARCRRRAARAAGEPRLGHRRAGARRIGGGLTAWARAATRRIGRPLAACRSSPSSPWRRWSARCRRSARSAGSRSCGRPRCSTTSLPMFRRYARFGVVVQLMAALLAGIGVDYLRRRRHAARRLAARRARGPRRRRVRGVAAGDVARRAADERAPLGDAAGRAAARARLRAARPESASVQWLTGDRVTLLAGLVDDCREPDLAAASWRQPASPTCWCGVTARGAARLAVGPLPDGLRAGRAIRPTARVFAVTAPPPAIYTAAMTGFFPREHDAATTWRWMGAATRRGRSSTPGRARSSRRSASSCPRSTARGA